MENQGKRNNAKWIGIIAAVIVVIAVAALWFTGIIGGISETEAKEIAYSQVPGAAEADAAIVTKDFDDLGRVYEVQFLQDNTLYEFTISARNGSIISQDIDGAGIAQQDVEQAAEQTQQPAAQEQGAQTEQSGDIQTAQAEISLEEAREIALAEVPGAAAGDITAAQLDNDDGRMVYEVEIRYDGQEYDFDIDAATGDIISRDQESVFD